MLQPPMNILLLQTLLYQQSCPLSLLQNVRLDDPPNGTVSITGFTAGYSALYSCSEGFELVGHRTIDVECMNIYVTVERRCSRIQRQWSADPPVCTCVSIKIGTYNIVL